MSQDIFIKFDGIEGESQDAQHKGEIEVLSWGWGCSQHSNMHQGSGGGAGKATVDDFSFEHYIDRASPNLLSYCLSGKHIKNVKFIIRKAGGDPLEYLTISFSDVIITRLTNTGSSQEEVRAREQVSFSFTAVTEDYVMQNAEGTKSGAVTVSYNVKSNTLN